MASVVENHLKHFKVDEKYWRSKFESLNLTI